MDKNKIKSYAVWARRAMIEAVKDRAFKVGIEENKIHDIERLQGGFKIVGREEIFNIPSTHRDTLVKLINEKGYEQVIEEVAYTWFNRFMGLRFMEVNEYLPTGVRILSSEDEGKIEPDVLTKINDIEDELDLNLDYVYELQDKGTEQAREELYKYILIKQCNELGKIIPQMFEKIQDYTELLLPDNLLVEGSVIRKMVTDINEEDWKEEVEIIGWMYQYYISEKKDEVFAALKKNVKITKENIPAATQLFTPKWIVKYMVENSLGRLWLEGHPNEELQKEWKYYLEEADQEPEVEEELKKIREEHSHLTPEDIKVLDPCMGSGHILVYAFDVLYQIYKEAGYGEREIPRKILQNNLYGLDIDDRAAQLASFALIMKARGYNRRLFREIEREDLELNLCSIQESNGITKDAIEYFANENQELKEAIEYLVNVFTDAKEYGAILEVKKVNFEELKQRLREIENEINLLFGDFREIILQVLPILIKQGEIINSKYHVCITNPPYMSRSGMNDKIKNYIDNCYRNENKDLFSVFIHRNDKFLKNGCFNSQVTMESWMFLSSFEEFRAWILKSNTIVSLIHMPYDGKGRTCMGISFGTVSFIFRKNLISEYSSKSMCIRHYELNDINEPFKYPVVNERYCIGKNIRYKYLPGYTIAYWANDKQGRIFKEEKSISNVAECKSGIMTGNDDLFLRLWHEVNIDTISFNSKSIDETTDYKWFPINKGGEYRKYYGNLDYIINLKNYGEEIKRTSKNYRLRDSKYYFKESISWSRITSSRVSFRKTPVGVLFGDAGPCAFPLNKSDINYILAILNSKISSIFLEMLNPTMTYQVIDIERIPYIDNIKNKEIINIIVEKIVEIYKRNWDKYEKSFNFNSSNLIEDRSSDMRKNYSTFVEKSYKEAEEVEVLERKLNEYLFEIYGFDKGKIEQEENKELRQVEKEKEVIQFISYAVGCMFGRYSIDVEGIIYAGGEFNAKWRNINNKWQVRNMKKYMEEDIKLDSWVDATFTPVIDNIIPITENEYFEEDIVTRFIEFVKVVYGPETLEENLDFIAESLGVKANETSRQTIRRYFLKEFYKDHLKIYKTGSSGNRPIYWMFDSGKNDGFKALVYMHRYNESTVAKLRTDYLHSLQRKYEAEILRLQTVAESTTLSAREKTQAKKKIDKINKQIEECKLYDQVVAHVANERISIDLDDGVKHNYGLFQGIKVPTDSGKEVKMDLLAKI